MPFRDDVFSGRYDSWEGWSNTSSSFTTSATTSTFSSGTSHIRLGIGPAAVEPSPNPHLRGLPEHVEASTETALELSPPIIWDTNHYYRLLGAPWPYRDATVAQMRRYYLEHGGPDDEEMTHALKQLRNPEVRRDYDITALGQRYLDKWVQEWLKKASLRVARERATTQRGKRMDITLEAKNILREWGFVANDGDQQDVQRELPTLPPEVSDPDATVKIPWAYSYYVWRSNCDDTDRLGLWQELLVQEFVRVGVKRRFAVGYMGRQPQEWVAGEVRNRLVCFLDEDTVPTEEMAAKLVASLNDGRMLNG